MYGNHDSFEGVIEVGHPGCGCADEVCGQRDRVTAQPGSTIMPQRIRIQVPEQ